MTDNMKKFLAFASADEALHRELKAFTGKSSEKLIALAASHGIKLTAEDFKPSANSELTEDELKAVSGGKLSCFCPKSGNGIGKNGFCECPVNGSGFDYSDSTVWVYP